MWPSIWWACARIQKPAPILLCLATSAADAVIVTQRLALAGFATVSWHSYRDEWTDKKKSQKGAAQQNVQAYRPDMWQFMPLDFIRWVVSSIKQPTEMAARQQRIFFTHVNTNYKNKTHGAYLLVRIWCSNNNIQIATTTVSRVMRGSIDEGNRGTWEDKQAALGKCLDLHFCVQREDK